MKKGNLGDRAPSGVTASTPFNTKKAVGYCVILLLIAGALAVSFFFVGKAATDYQAAQALVDRSQCLTEIVPTLDALVESVYVEGLTGEFQTGTALCGAAYISPAASNPLDTFGILAESSLWPTAEAVIETCRQQPLATAQDRQRSLQLLRPLHDAARQATDRASVQLSSKILDSGVCKGVFQPSRAQILDSYIHDNLIRKTRQFRSQVDTQGWGDLKTNVDVIMRLRLTPSFLMLNTERQQRADQHLLENRLSADLETWLVLSMLRTIYLELWVLPYNATLPGGYGSYNDMQLGPGDFAQFHSMLTILLGQQQVFLEGLLAGIRSPENTTAPTITLTAEDRFNAPRRSPISPGASPDLARWEAIQNLILHNDNLQLLQMATAGKDLNFYRMVVGQGAPSVAMVTGFLSSSAKYSNQLNLRQDLSNAKASLTASSEETLSYARSELLFSIFGALMVIFALVLVGLFARARTLQQRASQEIAARRFFLRSLMHEIKSPLHSIQLGLSLLAANMEGEASATTNDTTLACKPANNSSSAVGGGLSEDDYKSTLLALWESCSRLVFLSNSSLDLERVRSGRMAVKLERAQMLDKVGAIVNMLRAQIGERELHLTIKGEVKPDSNGVVSPALASVSSDPLRAWIMCDEQAVLSILSNLLSNAVKYSPAGEAIDITVTLTSAEEATGATVATGNAGKAGLSCKGGVGNSEQAIAHKKWRKLSAKMRLEQSQSQGQSSALAAAASRSNSGGSSGGLLSSPRMQEQRPTQPQPHQQAAHTLSTPVKGKTGVGAAGTAVSPPIVVEMPHSPTSQGKRSVSTEEGTGTGESSAGSSPSSLSRRPRSLSPPGSTATVSPSGPVTRPIMVTVSIRDRGPGIDPNDVDAVFIPFYFSRPNPAAKKRPFHIGKNGLAMSPTSVSGDVNSKRSWQKPPPGAPSSTEATMIGESGQNQSAADVASGKATHGIPSAAASTPSAAHLAKAKTWATEGPGSPRRTAESTFQSSGTQGLGLAVSREFARLHGGDVTLTSPPPDDPSGAGCVFTLTFAAELILHQSASDDGDTVSVAGGSQESLGVSGDVSAERVVIGAAPGIVVGEGRMSGASSLAQVQRRLQQSFSPLSDLQADLIFPDLAAAKRAAIQQQKHQRPSVSLVSATSVAACTAESSHDLDPYSGIDSSKLARGIVSPLAAASDSRLPQLSQGDASGGSAETNPSCSSAASAGLFLHSPVALEAETGPSSRRLSAADSRSNEVRPPTTRSSSNLSSAFGSLRALVVDDEVTHQRFLARLLKLIGVKEVEVASDGQEALEIIMGSMVTDPSASPSSSSSARPIDLCIVDRAMPRMTGEVFAFKARKAGYRGFIAALSADMTRTDAEAFLKAGSDVALHKPVTKADIVRVLELAIEDMRLNGGARGPPMVMAMLPGVDIDIASAVVQSPLVDSARLAPILARRETAGQGSTTPEKQSPKEHRLSPAPPPPLS